MTVDWIVTDLQFGSCVFWKQRNMACEAKPIGVAVVEHLGQYLVGIRGADGPLAGYAEFPGGKCLPNERPADCACRECQEESGLEVIPVKLLLNAAFEYSHGTVDLHFWLCRPADATGVAGQHQAFHWVYPEDFKNYRFPEGNLRLIELLVTGKISGDAITRVVVSESTGHRDQDA
jgi:8-oxo-dGTP diphosphatase